MWPRKSTRKRADPGPEAKAEFELRMRKRVGEIVPFLRADLLRALSDGVSAREYAASLVDDTRGHGTAIWAELTPEVRLNLTVMSEALLVVSVLKPLKGYAMGVWLHYSESIYGPEAKE
jgi:hypothetical protein